MQTFLPLATTNFHEIAKTLDNKRLHKQALEGWQILMVLLSLDPDGNHREPKGWVNHPAVKMWRGHESALLLYILAMVTEWKLRGYQSTIDEKAKKTYRSAPHSSKPEFHTYPSWIQDQDEFEAVATTHRQALLVKDYEWYSQFNWDEDPGYNPGTYEYLWPVEKETVNG
jgi:hypothetical protein